MKRIEFYKPQKSGNGAALTLECNTSNEDDKKNGFYVNILKQVSWNDETKNGSFKENVDKPDKHKKVKLTDLELCAILDVLEKGKNGKFSTVHKLGEKTTPIFFEPFLRGATPEEKVFVGFILKIDGVSIALNFPESIKIREYIKASLNSLYS